MNCRDIGYEAGWDAGWDADNKANKARLRDQWEPQVRDALLWKLESETCPQHREYGRMSNPPRPIDDFCAWCEDNKYFVAEILCPGELSRDEVVAKYQRMWLAELFEDGWEWPILKYELDIGYEVM